jgi:hypothetical protein
MRSGDGNKGKGIKGQCNRIRHMLAIQTDVPPTESATDMILLLLSKKEWIGGGKRFFRNCRHLDAAG